ncbi:hypothetical protein LIER_07087 [Lithospermum erythrorhizon]|uniref:Uncharacterized protein n=1 Tax=Lithospermum erythrorhizon TaxID=34254 RepID=A0AAV3P6R2_LITER
MISRYGDAWFMLMCQVFIEASLTTGVQCASFWDTTLVWEDAEIGTTVEQQQNNVDQEAAVNQPGEMDQETVDDENAKIEDNDTDAATP